MTSRVTAIRVLLRSQARTFEVEFVPDGDRWWRLSDCSCWRPGPCVHKRTAREALAAAFSNQPMPPSRPTGPVPAAPQAESAAFSPAPTSNPTPAVEPRISRNQQRSSR